MADLSERVYEIVSQDHGPVEYANEGIRTETEEPLSAFECSVRDWSLLFGLAFGIARGEDPYEPERAVYERALYATKLVWQRWNSLSIVKRFESGDELPVAENEASAMAGER